MKTNRTKVLIFNASEARLRYEKKHGIVVRHRTKPPSEKIYKRAITLPTTDKPEEFLTKEVLQLVLHFVKLYYFRFKVNAQEEDIYHDVVYHLITTNYLSRYDNSRSLQRYLSGFIYNHFCKVYKVGNYKVNKAVSLFKEVNSLDDLHVIDLIEAEDVNYDPEFTLFVKQIYRKLEVAFPYSSFVVYEGQEYIGEFGAHLIEDYLQNSNYRILTRSPATVFYLLSIGYSQIEITKFLRVSKLWASKIVTRISEFPAIKSYAKTKGLAPKNGNHKFKYK